jgi:hypothetical protein
MWKIVNNNLVAFQGEVLEVQCHLSGNVCTARITYTLDLGNMGWYAFNGNTTLSYFMFDIEPFEYFDMFDMMKVVSLETSIQTNKLLGLISGINRKVIGDINNIKDIPRTKSLKFVDIQTVGDIPDDFDMIQVDYEVSDMVDNYASKELMRQEDIEPDDIVYLWVKLDKSQTEPVIIYASLRGAYLSEPVYKIL